MRRSKVSTKSFHRTIINNDFISNKMTDNLCVVSFDLLYSQSALYFLQ